VGEGKIEGEQDMVGGLGGGRKIGGIGGRKEIWNKTYVNDEEDNTLKISCFHGLVKRNYRAVIHSVWMCTLFEEVGSAFNVTQRRGEV